MTNVNNNELGKFNEKAYRESRIERLNKKLGINGYRDIEGLWNSTESEGGKFETVFGNFKTNKQVATFFNAGWNKNKKQSNTLKHYTAESSEHFDELTSCGMRHYGKDELISLKNTFQTTFQGGFENDYTDSISITNRGLVLWPLEDLDG